MELFEALKKRRMVRQFSEEQIPDEVLRKLIYAGNRAPTGGNTPYRRLMLLRDPRILRLMRAVAPGYVDGNAAAIIMIYTDLTIAEGKGSKMQVLSTSRLDAGAAAENIHLAAIDLGLASAFFTSMSLEGVRELLNMPEHCRPEIAISVGYPGDRISRARRHRPEARIVFADQYGRAWN